MSLPVVAIVGRPNVGKSSLLNCLVGKRVAIVDSVPGVTRDRISVPVPMGEGYVELVDTGGYGIEDVDNLTAEITSQIDYAIATADLILFVVDAREGLTALDKSVAKKLRRQDKPVVLAANKVDTVNVATELGELASLGFGEPAPISALHRRGLADLCETIVERIGPVGELPDEPVMKLAIVGRRNVGKSTFINSLAGAERVIVSETPGTTRDSVDVTIEIEGRTFIAIDTAGVRKRRKVSGDIEFYARHRALRSIRRADVVLFLIDAVEPIGRVDRQLLEYIAEAYKPVVLVVNKWDLAAGKAQRSDFEPYLTKAIPELAHAPIIFTTAAEAKGVREAVNLALDLFAQCRRRVGTGQLNALMEKLIKRHAPRLGRRSHLPGKIYYATQVATAPPTIACFVNNIESFDRTYQRYLLNQLRQHLPFAEVPIRLIFRPREREK